MYECASCNTARSVAWQKKYRRHPRQLLTAEEKKLSRYRAQLKHRFGITPEDVNRMFHEQGGRCGICRQTREKLDIDHNHETGVVRGLLCRRCNSRILAFFENDPERLPRLLEWMNR